jgi:hypothetical protein
MVHDHRSREFSSGICLLNERDSFERVRELREEKIIKTDMTQMMWMMKTFDDMGKLWKDEKGVQDETGPAQLE